MKKGLVVVFVLLLLPSALLAQGMVTVSSLYGPVEWRSAASRNFVPLRPSTQAVQTGDEIRTGSGGTVVLEIPDGSYMVVSETSRLVIQDFWNPSFRSLINLMLGKVRFHIQRLGGRPNPYRVMTPSALIAIRGTTFEVSVDEAQIAEVRCFEGSVAVETLGLPEREVVLEGGKKTLVRPGDYPLPPVSNDVALLRNRVIPVIKKNVPEAGSNQAPGAGVLARDNDRRNRTSDPLQNSNSRTVDPQRAKPGTLSFPQ
jgi:hypothetical protein